MSDDNQTKLPHFQIKRVNYAVLEDALNYLADRYDEITYVPLGEDCVTYQITANEPYEGAVNDDEEYNRIFGTSRVHEMPQAKNLPEVAWY